MTRNRQILLVSRPEAEARSDNFRLVETTLPAPRPGQVLVRHHYLSLDPYMRGRMSEAKSYAPPQPLGEVMLGGTVGEVVASCHAGYAVGDKVLGMGGWQEHQLVDADQPGALRKIDTTALPISAYLGVVGMPGVTAWYGLKHIIAPRAGATVVVSAASGAVGSVVGQLAKAAGARAVGLAGGPRKCAYVCDELGFDACIDHQQHGDLKSLTEALRAACPQGIDGCFENVGGMLLDAAMLNMNAFGRIAVCGLIAGYNGRPIAMANPTLILKSRLRIEGFIVSEHPQVWPPALEELAAAVVAGKLRYRESISDGLASAPAAFIALLAGGNLGKQLVKLI